jgi:hypothetical protein
MRGTEAPPPALELANAASYLEAMHGTCMACHRRQESAAGRADLAECGTCHPSLRRRELQMARR